MTQFKDTQDIERKFKDVFAGAFPGGTSLEDKVKIINEFRQELKAHKGQVTKENLEKRLKDISAADNFSLDLVDIKNSDIEYFLLIGKENAI